MMTIADTLIIDADPAGLSRLAFDVDDDVALLMALRTGRVAALTVSWGNADAATCHTAARELLDAVGSDVPLYLGASCALPLPFACSASSYTSTAASDAIVRLVSDAPGRVTIVALGPLTNIAAALRARPQIARMMQLVIVGGSFDPAARGSFPRYPPLPPPFAAAAHFKRYYVSNFYWLPDLESARAVLGSEAPKVIVPLELMGQVA